MIHQVSFSWWNTADSRTAEKGRSPSRGSYGDHNYSGSFSDGSDFGGSW